MTHRKCDRHSYLQATITGEFVCWCCFNLSTSDNKLKSTNESGLPLSVHVVK